MLIIILNIIFLFISFWYSLRNPTVFVCLQILYYSQFLGFIPTAILVGGVDYGSFLINISIIFALLIKGPFPKQADRIALYSILFVVIFILYGIIKPVFDGNQPFLMGVKAGKSFFTYILFFYLLLYRKSIDFEKLFNFIIFVSLIFSILYIVNFVGIKLVPPLYEKNNFIQCKYDSFLAFSIAIIIYKGMKEIYNKNGLLLITLLFLGISIGGYFSLTASSALILLFTPLYKKAYSFKDVVVLGIIFCCYLGVFYLIIQQSAWYIELNHSQTNSLVSRERYNEFRWSLINKQLYFGWGFLYKTMSIVKSVASTGYMETFSFIDSGYVDLFGRFGIIGTFIFMLYPLYIILKSFRDKVLYPFAFFIIQFMCVNYTWSVFSFPMGITVLSIAYVFVITQTIDNQDYECETL